MPSPVPQRTRAAAGQLRTGVDNSLNQNTPRLTYEHNNEGYPVIPGRCIYKDRDIKANAAKR
jgi:hypothetical protein